MNGRRIVWLEGNAQKWACDCHAKGEGEDRDSKVLMCVLGIGGIGRGGVFYSILFVDLSLWKSMAWLHHHHCHHWPQGHLSQDFVAFREETRV